MSETITEKPTFAQRTLTLGAAAARQSWKLTKEFVAKQQEKRQIKRLTAVTAKYRALDQFRPVIDPFGMKKIDGFYAANKEDAKILESYFCGSKYRNLYSLGTKLVTRSKEDQSSRSSTHVFSVSSEYIIGTIDSSQFERFANSLVNKYKTSASGNALLTGALAHNRNYGLAALSAAEGISNSYKAGAYNEEVRQAFMYGIRCINFRQPASDLSDGHKYFLRAAFRLLCVGLGDTKALKRAYFALIYNNGDCLLDMTAVPSDFRNAVLCEFREAFAGNISTPSHAAAIIKDICEKGAVSENLFSSEDIRPWLQERCGKGDYWPA